MTIAFNPLPVTLQGRAVLLEALAAHHAEDLFLASRDEGIWRYMPSPPLESVEDAQAFIQEALEEQAAGREIPFAIIHRATSKAVGSTRYLDIQRQHNSLEIGWTWLAKAQQRTRVNTECKYLLLRHAFEELGAIRVQLKTDSRNLRSQRAIERLGAVREGTLRKQRRLWDGYVRDTVYYSILNSEWPGLKQRLDALLQG
jgi:RimJ/RimL family protein N-acetyltransferase